jgi:hypothetical protein
MRPNGKTGVQLTYRVYGNTEGTDLGLERARWANHYRLDHAAVEMLESCDQHSLGPACAAAMIVEKRSHD